MIEGNDSAFGGRIAILVCVVNKDTESNSWNAPFVI